MDIKFDEDSFVKYLIEVLNNIRLENSVDNNSVFNIKPDVWRTNDIIVRQNLILPFLNYEKDEEIDAPNDVNSIMKDYQETEFIIEKIVNKLNNSNLDIHTDQLSYIRTGIEGWVKYWAHVKKESPKEFNYDEDLKERFSKESSMEYCNQSQGKKDSIIEAISQIVFVCNSNQSLNKTFYTQEQEDWNSIKLALSNEKEIIIVDPYFFLSNVDGGKFGNRELKFLDAICKSEDEKDFVIIHQNCVCAEWLAEFSRRFKEGHKENEKIINSHKKCNLTFIGVTFANKQSLHDRFIISNYRLIFSGHSFPLYFDNNEKFSANGSIGLSVGSVADGNNEHVMVKTMEYLQGQILDGGHCFVYGDGKSHLLDLSKRNILPPNKGVLESYPYGEEIRLEWDNERETLHWKTFTTFPNTLKRFKGRNARIVNIRRNKESTYSWFSYAYVLNDNNNKDSQ